MIRKDKLIVALAAFFVLGGCSMPEIAHPANPAAPVTQVGRYQIAPIGSGSVFQIDTVTGEGWIVMPEGVIYTGTPVEPDGVFTPRHEEDTGPVTGNRS